MADPRHPIVQSSGIVNYLQRAATLGTVIKTLIGFVVGIGGVGLAVYQHFAKTSELRALQCSVIDQSKINNEIVRTSGEVRSALILLKQALDEPKQPPVSGKRLSEELSKAVGNINESLKKIDDVREKVQGEIIKGERKC